MELFVKVALTYHGNFCGDRTVVSFFLLFISLNLEILDIKAHQPIKFPFATWNSFLPEEIQTPLLLTPRRLG